MKVFVILVPGLDRVVPWMDPDCGVTMKRFDMPRARSNASSAFPADFFFGTDLLTGSPTATIEASEEVRTYCGMDTIRSSGLSSFNE
jgi:hypothetical protein